MNPHVLRAGIVGAGAIAASHAQAYAAVPGVELAAVVDLEHEKARGFAEQHGGRAYGTTAELLDAVDLVSVCTPPHAHAPVAIDALAAGRHVLCEKPIARTLDDGEAILAAADRSDGLLMVGLVSRFQRDLRAAKDLVERGRLGRVVMASDSITMPFPRAQTSSWHADFAVSGGVVLDLGIHSFDYLAWLFGEPVTRVHAMGTPGSTPDATYVLVNLRFAGGGIGRVEISFANPEAAGGDSRTEVVGTAGTVGWCLADTEGLVITTASGRRTMSPADDSSFVEEIAAFVDIIRMGIRESPIPGRDALAALRVALAAMRSLETGETVELHSDPVPTGTPGG